MTGVYKRLGSDSIQLQSHLLAHSGSTCNRVKFEVVVHACTAQRQTPPAPANRPRASKEWGPVLFCRREIKRHCIVGARSPVGRENLPVCLRQQRPGNSDETLRLGCASRASRAVIPLSQRCLYASSAGGAGKRQVAPFRRGFHLFFGPGFTLSTKGGGWGGETGGGGEADARRRYCGWSG